MSKGNPYHVKAGSPEGGQFTTGGTAGKKTADAAGTAARKAAGLKPEENKRMSIALE